MRGACDVGCIKARNEVEPHGEGYRGVITIVGQGSWQTPEAPSREGAELLLQELNAKLLPKPAADFSSAQVEDMKEALTAQLHHRARSTDAIKRQLGHGLR